MSPSAAAEISDHRRHQLLELSLISAQDLKPPPGPRRGQSYYAVAWFDPAAKVRTRADRGKSPAWNDRFLFRVPRGSLSPDSAAAVTVEIHAAGSWYLPDSLVGTVRLLLANHRLRDRPTGTPAFAAAGVRRPSGRIHGVLNVALTVLGRVPALAAEALADTPAIGYRDLMSRAPPPPTTTTAKLADAGKEAAVLREINGMAAARSDGYGGLCGIGFQRRIHLSPSDQNLHISAAKEGAKP